MKDPNYVHIEHILDFYSNPEMFRGFESSIFREDNPEKGVLPRLERAFKNTADGNIIHSRYAIWASSVNDLIENASRAIAQNDTMEAINQLEIASSAMKAYRDIEAVFEKGNLYKTRKIFGSYVLHLIAVDDGKSVILEKDEVVSLLRKHSQLSGIGLPRDINFRIKNGVLQVFIQNTAKNMQTDSAAFEGWILILKSWLPDIIKYVELDFSVPDFAISYSGKQDSLSECCGKPEACHYNRFLYRLSNMIRFFPDWFFLHENKMIHVEGFMKLIKNGNCMLNHSLKERASVTNTTKMERKIESWLAFEDGKELLCKLWDIDGNRLFNQLPIGVFCNDIAAKNAVFTRGARAIDLWGVGEDTQRLHLIELKCGENKGLGVISEVLFYTAVIYDSCIAQEGLFAFGKYKKNPDTKDMAVLKNNGKKFSQLFVHILAEKYHPLFITTVDNLIQDGLSNLKIDFDRTSYDYKKKVLIDENNNI